MTPTLTDAQLRLLRDLLAEVSESRGGPLPRALLTRFAELTRAGVALTVDFTAEEALGAPLVVVRAATPPAPSPCLDALSPREREVAGLVATGLRNRDIALALGISLSTVKDHVHRVLRKSGLDSRAAVAAAWRGG